MTDEDKAAQSQNGRIEEDSNATEPELNDVESLKAALAGQDEMAQKYLSNWQRSQADFINYKRRIEQERSDTIKFANAQFMIDFLPVMDDLERALDNIPADATNSSWIDGIELVYRKLLTCLENQGLTRIETEGKDFDPNYQQAMLYEEGEEGKVIEELQKGYLLHDRLLRPAMVKVGKG